jgi:adenine specific DNA methylase Mod
MYKRRLNMTQTRNTEPNEFQPNTIYCGDCKDILRYFPENSVDLIYADPPFFSNRRFEIIWNDGYELRAFEDRWRGGIPNYVAWMTERLHECHRVLKNTGSIYLHCDHHASHYLKVAMDNIFEERNFINEIVWQRQFAKHSDAKQGSKHFGRIHDVILFYAKSKDCIWHPQYTKIPLPASEEEQRKKGILRAVNW